MDQTPPRDDATQEIIDAFQRRMAAISRHHRQAVATAVQQALDRDLAIQEEAAPLSRFAALQHTSQRFVGHVGTWVRKGLPVSGGRQPTPTGQADDGFVLEGEWTVVEAEETNPETPSGHAEEPR